MSGFELRPLSLGELLDRAFFLYRRNFWLFAGIMLVPTCLIVPMQYLQLRFQGLPFSPSAATSQPKFPAYLFGIFLVYWLLYTVTQAAITFAVADVYLGRLSTIREAFSRIRGRFWRLIGVTFGVGLRVLGVMFLLIVLASAAGATLAAVLTRGSRSANPLVPGLILVGFVLVGVAVGFWFAMRYAVSVPVVLLEDIKGRAAIRRSVELSQGRRGQIFLAILLGIVVIYAVALLLQGPFYAGIAVTGIKGHIPNWLLLLMSVSSSVGGAIAGPLMMIILVVVYYDLRIRKEAFDLQHMISSLPEPNPAGSGALT
jgi:hypothetical protein